MTRRGNMKRLLFVLGLAVILAAPIAAHAKTSVTKITFTDTELLCNGDTLDISGPVLIVMGQTTTPSGGEITTFRAGPQGITAVDTTTGTVFHATGTTTDVIVTTPPGGYTETFINRFHLQATRGAQSFVVTETFHITFTPSGQMTALVDMSSSTC
jgi:hypothetical protein